MHYAATGAKLNQKGNERSEARSLFCALALLLSLVLMIGETATVYVNYSCIVRECSSRTTTDIE